MSLTLYEIAGADDACRWSPYCWRIVMALAHKGLDVVRLPVRFTEKETLAPSGQGLTPVLVDGDRWVSDSWAIACYLEDNYPDEPSLFGGGSGRALTAFIDAWVTAVVHPGVAKLVIGDEFDLLAAKDKPYFRETREARFGATLDAYVADRDAHLPAFRDSLAPARAVFDRQPFLAGEAPAYADYSLFGFFQWARVVSPYALLTGDDPLIRWRADLLAAFDGLALKTPGFPL